MGAALWPHRLTGRGWQTSGLINDPPPAAVREVNGDKYSYFMIVTVGDSAALFALRRAPQPTSGAASAWRARPPTAPTFDRSDLGAFVGAASVRLSRAFGRALALPPARTRMPNTSKVASGAAEQPPADARAVT